jgi:acetylornithine deacetylase/succinyl-diaminopimelate desuccinylase-like protein
MSSGLKLARSWKSTHEVKAVGLKRSTGSERGMADIVTLLHVPMAGVSIANYDDNQHAENENLRLGNFWDGMEVYAGLLTDLNW